MRHSWNPSNKRPPSSPKIGVLLRNAGCITDEQLQATVERQQRFPYFTFGQLVSLMHKVPMAKVDAICVRVGVLPQVAPIVMDRLVDFAGKDRFAKNLDPRKFITEMQLTLLNYEVMHIDSRQYASTGEEIHDQNLKRFVLTQGPVQVRMLTANGPVEGRVQIKHDSSTQILELAEDQDQIKTALYYGLRMKFNKTDADAVS